MAVRNTRILVGLGLSLLVVGLVLAIRFLVIYATWPSGPWRETLWIAAATHVAGAGLLWRVVPGSTMGLKRGRVVLGCSGALAIAGVAFVLLGIGQYGQWREYRDAPRCTASQRTLGMAAGDCFSEQAATVESIDVDTSPPSQYSIPARGQALVIALADGRTQRASVLEPPWASYGRVKARLYRGRVTRLTLPDGRTTDTDHEPGRYRLVAWFGGLCLLVALWPLLPVGLTLMRARRRGRHDE
jgi:hypothetical protein